MTTPHTGDLRTLTRDEVRQFSRMMQKLWAMATDEAYCRAYLFNAHPANLEIVTKYTDVLQERSAMIRKFAETYGRVSNDPSAPPTTLADAMTELTAYFAKRDEQMLTFLWTMYGRTSPRQAP